MKTVILDKCTVTRGDLDMSPLERLGETVYYDILAKEDIISALCDADIVVCNKSVIDREIMHASPSLKLICLFATGYNNIDVRYAREKGIAVCNVPGYSTDSVAQHTFSLILELACSTSKYVCSVARGDWQRAKQFSYFCYPISELSGKTLGIYGLGTIGMAVAKIGIAFGMRVIACTRTPKQMEGVELVDKRRLFLESDYLSLHCPLTDETAELVDAEALSLMKPTAHIVNTSRGGVIDENALAAALKEGRLAGAALDVLRAEPMDPECPLAGIENCIITPHAAWASIESRRRLIALVGENMRAFVNNEPINVVN